MTARTLLTFALVAVCCVACGAATTDAPRSTVSIQHDPLPRYDDPSVGTITGEGTCAVPYFALDPSGVRLRGRASETTSACGGEGPKAVFTFVLGTDESDRRAMNFVVQGELPVQTSNFLIVQAGHIAIERPGDAPDSVPQEQIDQLAHFSDQWALLGDIANAQEAASRRAGTYRAIRQSMESLNTVRRPRE